jgi:hypothetical protein
MPLPDLSAMHTPKASLLVFLALLSGCAHVEERQRSATAAAAAGTQAPCRLGANRWVRTELYFGLSRPDGSLIEEEDFRRFLDSEVTPRFRSGFTVIDARGQFLSETGALVRESSKVLVLLYSPDEGSNTSVEDIRKAYRTRFQQESVLRVDAAECVSF